MRTFSHALITIAAVSPLGLKRSNINAALAGSIIPDMALYILTLYTMLSSPSFDIGMQRMHDNYANNMLWISAHIHSLVVLGLLAFIGYLYRRRLWAQSLLWFSAGAMLHTFIDIFTHAGDGPRFLFPLSTLKFDSPISYWDSLYFGRQFTVFEYLLDSLIICALLFRWYRHKFTA